MKKIISLFQRNYESDHLVRDEIVPGAEWVVAGEGVATRKWDGTCCLIQGGMIYKRYDAKKGKTPPNGFMPAQDADPVTGHWPGWLEVNQNNPADKYFIEAWNNPHRTENTTYELIGPKINGNPEKVESHQLVQHGEDQFLYAPRTFNELKEWFKDKDIEGIVWWHNDGRMVKIKKKDFGYKR